MVAIKILPGQKYGLLMIQKLLPGTKKIECVCDCGKTVIAWKNYLPRSCGCTGKGSSGTKNQKRSEMNLEKVKEKLRLLPDEFSVKIIADILYEGDELKSAKWASWNYRAGHIERSSRGVYKKIKYD